jgi:hypothetical protein
LSPQGESHAAAVVSIEGRRDGRLGGTVPVECGRHLLSPAYRPVRQFIEELEATNLEDFALSFGGGVGLMVDFGSSPWPGRLDVSVRYLRGGEADYLTEGAIRREGGQAFLDISRSPTHMVLVYIGISIGR